MEKLNTKPITMNFYQHHSDEFFRGKKAILNTTVHNEGGKTLTEGTIVTIIGKNKDFPKRSVLDIKHNETNIEMLRIFCENLELIENPEDIEVINPEIVQ